MSNLKDSGAKTDFLVDVDTWNRLPWSGWRINRSGYVSCCGVTLHLIVAYLNGYHIDRNTIIDHKNRNRLDNRRTNLRTCTSIENGWNNERRHGHQLKNGKWRFTFSKSYPTMAEAEDGLRTGGFQYMNSNRTCFMAETFDTYEEGWQWWKFNAGIHYGEFSPFANPYKTVDEIVSEASGGSTKPPVCGH